MKRFFIGVFSLTLLAGMSSAQQQTPAPGQQKSDTPRNESGKRNPNQKQDKRQHSHASSQETTTEPANPGDVPHQGPGAQSPDLKQHSTQSTTLSTGSHHRTKRKPASKHTRSTETETRH